MRLIDVSEGNGSFNWNQVITSTQPKQVDTAYIRVGEGIWEGNQFHEDARFKSNRDEIDRSKLDVGFYWAYHQEADTLAQLTQFIDLLNGDYGSNNLPLMVDIEVGKAVWTAQQNKDLQWFLWILWKITDKKPLIYTNTFYWNMYVNPSASGNPDGTNSWANGYPLWLALWSNDVTIYPHKTEIPHPWDNGNGWFFWQWSNVGKVAGINGNVDLSISSDNPIVKPPVVVVPPTVNTNPKPLGLAVIFNRDAAFQAAQAGCRSFSIIGNVALASELKDKYPDAWIMVRPYLNVGHNLPANDYVISQLSGFNDTRLIYTGVNEDDQIDDKTPDNIIKRSQFDIAMAKIAVSKGCKWAAGSWCMGCVDYTNQSICDAMKVGYADAFNSGLLGMDFHLYSPSLYHVDSNDDELIWYETRWKFVYLKCGFQTGKSFTVCSETGFGFNANNATDEQVKHWMSSFMMGQRNAGRAVGEYERPLLYAMFAVGDPVGWKDFDMVRYEGAMNEQGWGK